MVQKPQAIFFDWDGTIVDSIAFLTKAHNHVKAALNLPLFASEKEYVPYFGMARDKLYSGLYGAQTEDALKLFESYVFAHHINDVQMLDGATALIDLIHSKNIASGVVSNKKRCFLEPEIKKLGFEDIFLSVVGAGDAQKDKPAPDPLYLGLERAGLSHLDFNNVWYVGDTLHDIHCAQNAGAKAVYLNSLDRPVQYLDSLEEKPSLIFQNLPEFTNFLQTIA